MRVSKSFLKEIPREKREIVLRKVYEFNEQLLESRSYREMPKGFWIRQVKGTNIYKFRINNGDRVLFSYSDIEDNQIVLISYKSHDKQILKAKNISNNDRDHDYEFNIVKEEYIENPIEENEDIKIYQNAKYQDISELNSLVLEDEYICLLIDDNDKEYLKYISEEQYECLRILNKPTFVTGSAGAGKSVVGIRKIILNSNEGQACSYITYSKYLKNNSIEQYEKINNSTNRSPLFTTINELCFSLLNEEEVYLIDFNDFRNWLCSMEGINLLGLTFEEIWYEISNIIKGKDEIEFMIKEQYLAYENSEYSIEEKSVIYNIAKIYKRWMTSNGYIDENDLAIKTLKTISENGNEKYDFLVIDEIQDMNQKQVEIIFKLSSSKNIMFIWDENQVTRYNDFKIGKVKSKIYTEVDSLEERILNKNYRNSKEIDRLAKKILELKNNYNSNEREYFRDNIDSIRQGKLPIFLDCNKEDILELLKKADMDTNIAIVTFDESDKKELEKQNVPLGRVFTVNEIKGLDYKTIICVNIMTRLREYIIKVRDAERKNKEVILHKFNKTYVAITRARNILCIVEEDNEAITEDLLKYLDINNEIKYSALEMDNIVGDEIWIKEGERLEKAGRYYQAAEAYKKANSKEKAIECEGKIIKKKKELDNKVKATAIRIESNKGLNFYKIKKALDLVCKTYKIEYDSYIEVVARKGENLNINKCHIDACEEQSTQIGNVCMSILGKDKNIKKLTVHVALISNDKIIELEDIVGSKKDTIIIDIASNNKMSINILRTRTEEQEVVSKLLEEVETANMLGTKTTKDSFDLKMFSRANKLYMSGRYEDAIQIFEKLLEDKNGSDMNMSIVCSSICGCKVEIKEYDEAIYYGELANEYDKSNNDGYVNTGTAYLNLGKFENALECYKKAEYKGEWKNAINIGKKAAMEGIKHRERTGISKITLDSNSYNNMIEYITKLINAGNLEEAEELLIKVENNYNITNTALAGFYGLISLYYYQKVNDRENAVRCISKAKRLDPQNKNSNMVYNMMIKGVKIH